MWTNLLKIYITIGLLFGGLAVEVSISLSKNLPFKGVLRMVMSFLLTIVLIPLWPLNVFVWLRRKASF